MLFNIFFYKKALRILRFTLNIWIISLEIINCLYSWPITWYNKGGLCLEHTDNSPLWLHLASLFSLELHWWRFNSSIANCIQRTSFMTLPRWFFDDSETKTTAVIIDSNYNRLVWIRTFWHARATALSYITVPQWCSNGIKNNRTSTILPEKDKFKSYIFW